MLSCARASVAPGVVAGLLTLGVLALWWAHVSPASAQSPPIQEIRECIIKVLWHLPANLQELTNEQRRAVERDCPRARGRLGEVLRGPLPPGDQLQPQRDGQQPRPVADGASDEELLECVRKVLGKLPANLAEVTEEQRRLVVRSCPEIRERLAEVLRKQPLRPTDQQQPSLIDKQPAPVADGASGVSDETLKECIRKALGKLPANLGEVTEEQRRLIVRSCPEVRERLEEVLGKQQQLPTDQQEQPQPSDQQPAPVAADVSKQALRECIRKALGYLPEGTQEMTNGQRRIAEQACPEVRGRLGELLVPRTDAATQQCIQNILRRVPGRAEEVNDQERRQIQESCFSEVSGVPGQPVVAGQPPLDGQGAAGAGGGLAADAFQQLLEQQLALMQEQQRLEQVRLDQEQERLERESQEQTTAEGEDQPADGQPNDEGPRRGFFTNSAAGEANAVDKIMDPSTLAVLGILLTFVATSLSLLKGN